jgi:heat shock protein HslJ
MTDVHASAVSRIVTRAVGVGAHQRGTRFLVVMSALLLAACSSGSHRAAAPPTTRAVPSTVQPTTTLTPTNVTVAALVGSWREMSIPGYHGALTSPPLLKAPVLRFDTGSRWTGSDGCNAIGGTYTLTAGGTFHFVYRPYGLVGCGPNLGPQLDTAARVELLNGRLTFFARDGHELAQYERPTVTARVVLPSHTMRAGSSMLGHVVVENNTGAPLERSGCISLFSVFLGNASIAPHPAFPACLQAFTIPVGRSSYAVSVVATYLECGGAPLGNGRPCAKRNGQTVMPSLPPGRYQATLWGNIVPTPPPITVRVAP